MCRVLAQNECAGSVCPAKYTFRLASRGNMFIFYRWHVYSEEAYHLREPREWQIAVDNV